MAEKSKEACTEKLKEIQKDIEKHDWSFQPSSTQSKIKELSKFLDQSGLQNNSILAGKVINAYEKAKCSGFSSIQGIADLLPELEIKLKSTEHEFKPSLGDNGDRLGKAENALRAVLEENEDVVIVENALASMPGSGEDAGRTLFKLSRSDAPKGVLERQIHALALFLDAFACLEPEDVQELSDLQEKTGLTTPRMMEEILEKADGSDACILDSKEKIMEYFFPQKQVGNVGERITPAAIVAQFRESKDPQIRELAETVMDKYNAVLSYASYVGGLKQEELSGIKDWAMNFLDELTGGNTETTVILRLLMRKDTVEPKKALEQLDSYLDKQIMLINDDHAPLLQKKEIMITVGDLETMAKGGLHLDKIGNTESLDHHAYMDELKEMLSENRKLNTYIMQFVKKKAEEELPKAGKFTENQVALNKIFEDFEEGIQGHHPNEYPLINAMRMPILENMRSLKCALDDLITEIKNEKNISESKALTLPLNSALKNEDDSLHAPLKAFIDMMDNTAAETKILNDASRLFARLSMRLVAIDEKLPIFLANNPEFVTDPVALNKMLEDVNKLIVPGKLSKEEFNKKSNAMATAKEIAGTILKEKETSPELWETALNIMGESLGKLSLDFEKEYGTPIFKQTKAEAAPADASAPSESEPSSGPQTSSWA